MIAGNHHHRHLRARDSAESERQALLAHAAGIEQIAHDEEQVGVAIVGDLDHIAERLADLVAQLYAGIGRAEGVGLEMNVRGMDKS